MSKGFEREYLSFGDALFLHLERQGIPINIASVAIFEGRMSLEELLPYVETKLSQVPRCLQRVVAPPFNIGLPSLEYDPDFDFCNHIDETTLEHGTEEELKALAGKLLSENLDRNRPLWHFMVVHGLSGNRTALICRIHHSMADGMSGVAFLNALMDENPDVPEFVHKKVAIPVTAPRDPATTLLEALTNSWFLTVERLLNAQSDLLTMARRILSTQSLDPAATGKDDRRESATPSMDHLSKIFPEIASAPERMPFNKICGGPQVFEWTEVPFEVLRSMKKVCECSFNDVALAVITSTFGRYIEHRGESIHGRSVRIVVPVNTRPPDDDSHGMGNQITFVPVSIPLDIRDPKKLIAAAHQRMSMIKQAKVAEMVSLAGALIAAIPSPVQVAVGPIVAQLPLVLCNLIFTNVPGPQRALYLMGHKMLRAYPYVPIGGEMGANCALLTYDGTAQFGFSCDTHATPESHLLPEFLQQTVAEMKHALGICEAAEPGRSRRKKAQPSRTKPRKRPRQNTLVKETPEKSATPPRQASETEPTPELALVGD